MYLKSIEIHGFKSFAVRIKFEFHNGITAIVGPNGSGKSNVADAVRWVLGEQRVKQLRGASMQDVIFAGTETRKPMGYAYVAITLDNSDHQLAVDYAEVTIARRLYRSGESEYLLNGTAVRLKDVSELFYDTGIGKEGYSIIGQGQIDKILSDRPEDRRELFDEAAGIVKFKRRKDEAVKKLTVEQDNLVRVTDILSELEKQIGPLEKQSEKAQVYLKAREEQKKLDVNLFLVENSKVHEKLKETVQQLEITGNDLTAARTEFDDTKTGYDQVQSEIEVLDKAIAEAREAITHTSVVRGQLEGSIKVAEEQIRAAKQNAEHFTVRRGSIGAEIDRVSAEKEKILSEKSGVDEKASELTKSREEVSSRLDAVTASIQDKNEASESGKRSILQALEERSTIKSRLASLTTQEESINIRKSELTGKLVRAQSDKSEQDSAIAAAEKMFELVSSQVAELQHKKSEAETELAGMKSQLSSNDEKLQAAQIHFHEEQSRLDALKNLTERYEGFGGSVRRVMENKGRENGLIGVVADLIKTDEKYETAIEVALGGNIQNIVTKDEDTAKRMIDLLKREKAGRSTFLPLSTIQNAQEFSAKDALREPGAIGLADTLVKTDAAYRSVAKSLLGRILVVDSFDHAAAIGRKYRHTVRLVTLEGELFVPGGAISGGAFQRGGNLLGRRREIAELEKKVAEYKAAAETAQQAITGIKTRRNELRSSLETLGGSIQQKLIEQNTARLNIARERDRQKEQTGSYEQLKQESASIQDQTEEIAKQKEEITARLAASEQAEKETNAQIEALQKELQELRVTEAELGASMAEWDLELGKIRQKEEFQQENLDRINEELARYEAELKEINESIEAGEREVAEKARNIEEIRKTVEASHDAQGETEKQLNENGAKKEELAARQKAFFDRRETLSAQISGLDKESYRLSAQKDRLQEQLDTQINYMWDEYQITLSDAEGLRDESMANVPDMKKQIAVLKQQIRDLGPVNVQAIEDYRTVMERYTFLNTQHDDLVKAAEDLKQIITNLDESMRRQFKEQFAAIDREFNSVFKELFGGGHGSLELVEDEDVLEAGVRVIAQPPGKKLQNIMQMSGGEKALTAIALLFAIQNLKPSPFCLLDEIEAALDENNVGRFSDYLKKLTKHTQFIVITHRRGTMERADRLYGITMQEKGVSALVSVNLIDKDLTN